MGQLITIAGISLYVKFGCNGLEAVLIYAGAILSFPATWKKKLLGIIAGFIVIQIVNIIRIVALAYSCIYFKNLFEYIHIYIAEGIMRGYNDCCCPGDIYLLDWLCKRRSLRSSLFLLVRT